MSYDAWREAAPDEDEGEAPPYCPVCNPGDPDAEVCGEPCWEVLEAAHRSASVKRNRAAAKKALKFARRYEREGGEWDRRAFECREQARQYLEYARSLTLPRAS